MANQPFFFVSKGTIDAIYAEKIRYDREELLNPGNILPFSHFTLMIEDDLWYHVSYFEDEKEWVVGRCIGRKPYMVRAYAHVHYMDKKLEGTITTLGIEVRQDEDLPDNERAVKQSVATGVVKDIRKGDSVPGLGKEGTEALMHDIDMGAFHSEKEEKATFDYTRKFINMIITFFLWAEGKHQVRVRPAGKRKKVNPATYKQKPWTNPDRPHYIYLDAPQKEAVYESEGDEEKAKKQRRGHHRRACWVHLKHERFKNHPMYGKKIRRRATWVGPTEWRVGGTIYTFENKDEDEDEDDDE